VTTDLAETLPLAQRLALSYAPRSARAPALALLALDQRLAAVLRAGGQNGDGAQAIAQIKLAWWRERLREGPANWPEGEPLLALLRDFPGGTVPLADIVDGWEMLLTEDLDQTAIAEFASGRASGWQALGGDGAGRAARNWAMADLWLNLPEGEEATNVRATLDAEWNRVRLPRQARPLQVLHALAGRALRRDAGELLDGPGAMFTAMRVGIIGR